MGYSMMKWYLPLFLLLSSCQYHSKESDQKSDKLQYAHLPIVPKEFCDEAPGAKLTHIFYLIQQDKIDEAIERVLTAKNEDPYLFHSGLLERIGLAILEQGQRSSTPEDTLTTLYGIGISQDEQLAHLVDKAFLSDNPQLELLAISVLASFQNDEADALLIKALKSNYIFVRLEAAYALASKKSPEAFGQIQALMHKLDPEFRPLFPRLFAIDASHASKEQLLRLLFDHDEKVRIEAILASSQMGNDDFLTQIKMLSSDPSPAQQEAVAFALGHIQNASSIPHLERIAKSDNSAKLAAYYALYQLGQKEAGDMIIEEAEKSNPFAIRLLGSVAASDNFLISCLKSRESMVRINAALALLDKKNSHSVPVLESILIDSHRDYTFQPIYSNGYSQSAWKVVPSSSQQFRNDPTFFEMSLRMREQTLVQAAELPEEDFLYLASKILAYQQKDLIPLCVQLLQNMHTPASIALLKQEEQALGAPFVRAWCRLALFRLNEPGPYGNMVRAMLEKHEDKEVFQARPVLPWRMREEESRYALTLEESAQLLLESYQALAERQDEKGIELLLKAIRNGNVHNRYTLAGLLMRSSR
jgi:HEAT repeat protein